MLLRLLCFLILLGLSSFMILNLSGITEKTESNEVMLSERLLNASFSQIENAAKLLDPLDSCVANLARTLVLSLDGAELTFDAIKTKFLLYSDCTALIPGAINDSTCFTLSYTGLDGLSFLYYRNDKDETFVLFSNSSSSSSTSSSSSSLSSSACYAQPVDRDTGKLNGQIVSCDMRHVTQNVSSVQRSVNVSSSSSLVRREWGKGKELMFLYSAAMDGRGLITIGYPAKVVADHFDGLQFYGGDFQLAMSSGQVIVESKLEDTRIDVRNGTVSVETVNTNGDVQDKSDYYSCRMGDGDGGQLSHFHMKIQRKTHIFYCSVLEVGGFESVYVLSFPNLESLAHKNGVLALVLLVCMLATIVISIVFIIIILKSANHLKFQRAEQSGRARTRVLHLLMQVTTYVLLWQPLAV
ncbi:UNVERIFIED_CONTAM: hypothetical protein Sradi_4756200 [Sesamum radiatum]|uniref:DOMON domain-containing protein n=1 Tax=Sesamum radiatum TaxID=300843 RepID=A0AAW2MX77_SESRA